jgi:hypothetical protein
LHTGHRRVHDDDDDDDDDDDSTGGNDINDINDDYDPVVLDDGTPKFNNDNYVLVHRSDYDNLVAALNNNYLDANVVDAARDLIDHVHDDTDR